MNKKEAFKVMQTGLKINCDYFMSNEYLQFNEETQRIENEENNPVTNFWQNDFFFGVLWHIY